MNLHQGASYLHNLRQDLLDRRKLKQLVYFTLFRACGAIVVLALIVLLYYILSGGLSALSWDFLTEFPRRANTQGGIFPAIIGTLYLMLIVLVTFIPIGILSAIYLVEYEKREGLSKLFRIAVHNLSGVPSVVYGLLGLGVFVYYIGFGFSLIAGALTLGIMVLPLIIAASREAIKAVPSSIREASLALGATKWQTVRHHVLPYSMAGILTGIILSLSRAAGETAPIWLTGVAVTVSSLPDSLTDSYMALPYHIYYLATQSADIEGTRPLQYATVIVLLALVIGMNLFAIHLRNKYRKKYRW